MLVARDGAALNALAVDIRSRFGVHVEVIVADLLDARDHGCEDARLDDLREAHRPPRGVPHRAARGLGLADGNAVDPRAQRLRHERRGVIRQREDREHDVGKPEPQERDDEGEEEEDKKNNYF